jgi:hypothetical protein
LTDNPSSRPLHNLTAFSADESQFARAPIRGLILLNGPGLLVACAYFSGSSALYASETPRIKTSEVTSEEDLAGPSIVSPIPIVLMLPVAHFSFTQFLIMLRVTEHTLCL